MIKLLRSVLVAFVLTAVGTVVLPGIASAAVIQPAPVVLQPTGWEWGGNAVLKTLG